MRIRNCIFACFLAFAATSAWSDVFLHWTAPALPPATELGLRDMVLSWNNGILPQLKAARSAGYRVYLEVSLEQAANAVETGASALAGIILIVHHSDEAELEKSLPKLRSAYPKLRILVLNPDGKTPEMRGGLVIKRGSVLEVSSPTEQPWINTNLSLVKIEQRSRPRQVPLYTFSWAGLSNSAPQETALTAENYALAVAEAGAFHADLLLELDDHLQKGLAEHDPQARRLWSQVLLYVNFYSHPTKPSLEAAANVAVVVDDLDASDEVMNLLARHNIPFKVLRPVDLGSTELDGVDIAVMFANPDRATSERLRDIADQGKTAVIVDAHGSYPWQLGSPVRINEHAVSYAVGKGKVLELSEPVTDPETFAQDIRRLLGTQSVLISLWNALTTIAVPYQEHGGPVTEMEFVNYAEEPLRLQLQVKGSFASARYETPEHKCCESLVPTKHNGFTEFVIPELRIAGRVHLEVSHGPDSQPRQ